MNQSGVSKLIAFVVHELVFRPQCANWVINQRIIILCVMQIFGICIKYKNTRNTRNHTMFHAEVGKRKLGHTPNSLTYSSIRLSIALRYFAGVARWKFP